MKKTVTINLDKTIFNIDDDAYELLEAYLQSLNEHFAHEEGGQEILNDIESRIAELFKERLGFGMQVITRQEVNEVIAIMGRPDEIETPLEGEAPDEGGTPGETASASSPTDENNNGNNSGSTPEPERRSRRLYRDPDNRVLGGVASGIAYYIGLDVVLVRVILVLLLPLWASSIWIYLLLWICVPEARTTAQKLEMRGETPTVDNIRRAVEEEHTSGQSTDNSLGRTVGEIFRGIFKIFFIFIGGLIALSIIATLVTCIVSLLGFLFLGTTTITSPSRCCLPSGYPSTPSCGWYWAPSSTGNRNRRPSTSHCWCCGCSRWQGSSLPPSSPSPNTLCSSYNNSFLNSGTPRQNRIKPAAGVFSISLHPIPMPGATVHSRLSTPHISLARNVSAKLWPRRFTTLMEKGALRSTTGMSVSSMMERPSRLSR